MEFASLPNQFQNVLSNFAALGPKRLAALLTAAILIFALIGIGARYVNKPAFQTLYVGLERDDINRIGIVLSDAGIGYDVDESGNSILVETGKTSKARMILAEKGLPSSSGAGYELFDKLGSLGLTSFMQEVTRVRVLEGEIARSIQAISGIKAARVHIVQPDRRSFGSRNSEATASVLVRTNGAQPSKSAFAIRHLVAAAVPSLSTENVTVLDASGKLLAAGEDPATTMLNSSISIQRMVEEQLKTNISRALSPYLGSNNFRVSVQAVVNTDKRQIEETIFDPESRVERSVQVVKTQDTNSQKSAGAPATVEQNLPNAEAVTSEGPQSSQASERREETTNYELNSKKIATTSNGFSVKKLSASVVINENRINEVLGSGATPAQVVERVEQIKKVAMAAAGFDANRGDVIDVTAVEFSEKLTASIIPEPTFMDKIADQLGTMINSIAFLIGSVLLIFLGIRPLVSVISGQTDSKVSALEPPITSNVPSLERPENVEQLASPQEEPSQEFAAQLEADSESLFGQLKKSPQERLQALTVENEEVSAQVLRRWIDTEAA